jgi:hypothetical protein
LIFLAECKKGGEGGGRRKKEDGGRRKKEEGGRRKKEEGGGTHLFLDFL